MISLGKEPVPEISFGKSFSLNTPYTWKSLQTFESGLTSIGLITANNGITVSGLIAANGDIAVPSTTILGSTSGTLVYAEPFISKGYKKVVVNMSNYENTTAVAQVITFPTAFTTVSVIISNLTGIAVTLTNTNLTFPTAMTATVTGVIIIEGY